MDRIGRKQRDLVHALRAGPQSYHRLAGHMKELHLGAWTLARRVGTLRAARSRLDREALSWDLARLEGELPRLTDAETRASAEAAIGERRKTLAALTEIEQAEARCVLRLATLEATLDTACLTFRRLQRDQRAAPPVEVVRRELEAEIAAIAEEESCGKAGCSGVYPRTE
jgi:hypothetical protein